MINVLAQGLVWVRFGTFGRQLAHIDRAATRDVFIGFKWRENSRTWVGPLRIPRFKIEGGADLEHPVVQHALKAGAPGKPPCSHRAHGFPDQERTYTAAGDPLSGDPL